MGRASTLTASGFTVYEWQTIAVTDEGYRILIHNNGKGSQNLPSRSNSPNTIYIKLNEGGSFSQLRLYDSNRKPVFDIDYSVDGGKIWLHYHRYIDEIRQPAEELPSELYNKYKNLLEVLK